jgi:hypothetical protein
MDLCHAARSQRDNENNATNLPPDQDSKVPNRQSDNAALLSCGNYTPNPVSEATHFKMHRDLLGGSSGA